MILSTCRQQLAKVSIITDYRRREANLVIGPGRTLNTGIEVFHYHLRKRKPENQLRKSVDASTNQCFTTALLHHFSFLPREAFDGKEEDYQGNSREKANDEIRDSGCPRRI
jgi:hypothetical protein